MADGGKKASKAFGNAWRGAAAYHYYMLAQRQFYAGVIYGCDCDLVNESIEESQGKKSEKKMKMREGKVEREEEKRREDKKRD